MRIDSNFYTFHLDGNLLFNDCLVEIRAGGRFLVYAFLPDAEAAEIIFGDHHV